MARTEAGHPSGQSSAEDFNLKAAVLELEDQNVISLQCMLPDERFPAEEDDDLIVKLLELHPPITMLTSGQWNGSGQVTIQGYLERADERRRDDSHMLVISAKLDIEAPRHRIFGLVTEVWTAPF